LIDRSRPRTDAAVARFLHDTSLFARCAPEVAVKVAAHVELAEAAAGTFLVRAGSSEREIGILMEGRASVSLIDPSTGKRRQVYSIETGDHFGEVGTLLHEPQPHDVIAEEPCRVLFLRQRAVDQLCTKIPAFAQALASSLADRLKNSTSRPPPDRGGVGPVTAVSDDATLGRSGVLIPFVRVSSYELVDAVVDMVPAQLIEQHRIIPLELRDRVLTIGMVDPLNEAALGDLRRVLEGAEPQVVAISIEDFEAAKRRLKRHRPVVRGGRAQRIDPNTVAFDDAESKRESDRALQRVGEQVIQLATEVVAAGLERGASDIHLEPMRKGIRVRYRVNGLLSDWEQAVQPQLAKALLARFKVLAQLDIAERRRPQDGRIGVRIGPRRVDLRVSTLPSSEGEKVAVRILEASAMLRSLDQVFVEQRTLRAMRETLQRPYGAIVIAGSTGSGKTSSLYAALHERQTVRPDTNIITVEDPIEYELDGVTQVQVNHAIGLGFAEILRAMLRQDPDVLMIGEVRDSETAQLALEAAITGHLILTSIHASNAGAVIQRFENLGCDRALIAQSVALVLVQRLARRLCPRCTVNAPVSELMRESLVARGLVDPQASTLLPRASGCEACDQTGFLGRIAVVESLRLSEGLRSMLMADRPLDEVLAQAKETGFLIEFPRYAGFMMEQQLIGPAEALLAVAS
jgi:type IV pilus assembly protein PilB